MRLAIDMQGAQSASSRHRGIGRYTLALSQAIAANRGDHEIILCLNGMFPDSIAAIREAFAALLPAENIKVWTAPGPVASLSAANDWRRRSAELIREAFLASLKPDMVLVSSLFEGLDENVVTSIGALSQSVPTAAILYDLIPLVHRERYLENPVVAAWYEEKLEHLRRADLLLSISEASRQEGIAHLGVDPGSIVNASTAADAQFRPMQVDASQRAILVERYGLDRCFVMYTGGIDHRKNIDGLIRAYAQLPRDLRAEHQLAVVCSVQPAARAGLEELGRTHGLKAGELVLTGFVPEEDLLALYNLCKAFVFPSWHEGFGLPALEAMSCGRAVIGANNSSVPEVIGYPDALFDPRDDAAISAKLAQVLGDEDFRAELAAHGLEQAKCFSWDASAKRAIAAIENAQAKRESLPEHPPVQDRRLRLAYISPLQPERSGISDYSSELLPALAEHYDIEVVVAQPQVSDAWITGHCPVRSIDWFCEHVAEFDRVVYQFGNSKFHSHMFDMLQRHPGVVTLHDFFLSGVLAHEEQTGVRPGVWSRALYHSHGYTALRERCGSPDPTPVIWRYPCNLEVLQNALSVVVHGENSVRLARHWYGEAAAADWAVIPLLRVAEKSVDRAQARRTLGLQDDDFVVCSFGLLAPTKLNHRLLDAWLASDLARNDKALLVFVGEYHDGDYSRQFLQKISRSGVQQRIQITGWTDAKIFRTYLAAADVGVQLRTLSRGETSASALDCMNYGLATIVNAHGSMADLPPDAVCLLDDEFTDQDLCDALESLWRDQGRRSLLAARAREMVLSKHDPRVCAAMYRDAIEAAYRRAATGRHALVSAIAALGRPAEGAELAAAAEAVAATCLPCPLQRQLLVDVSALIGPECAQPLPLELTALLHAQPDGFKVEPVYSSGQGDQRCHRYARAYTCKGLGIVPTCLADENIDVGPDDVWRDLSPAAEASIESSRQNRLRRDHEI